MNPGANRRSGRLHAPSGGLLVQLPGQGHLHRAAVVRHDHVEVEAFRIEGPRRHGAEAVLLGQLLGDAPGLGVDDLVLELSRRLLAEFPQRRQQLPSEERHGLRQLLVRRDVAPELHGLIDAGEQRADVLESVQHLLDGPGKVVLEVPQADVGPRTAALDLDQIREPQHLVLVAVLKQQVEVRIDQRGLVAVLGAERDRTDAVTLVGFLLETGLLPGIHELRTYTAAAGGLDLADGIADPGHHWSQQRVGAGAEVTADEQRLPQLGDKVPGRLGNGVVLSGGEVRARGQPPVQPEVGQDEIDHHQRGHRPPGAVARPLPLPATTAAAPGRGRSRQGKRRRR